MAPGNRICRFAAGKGRVKENVACRAVGKFHRVAKQREEGGRLNRYLADEGRVQSLFYSMRLKEGRRDRGVTHKGTWHSEKKSHETLESSSIPFKGETEGSSSSDHKNLVHGTKGRRRKGVRLGVKSKLKDRALPLTEGCEDK